MAPGTNLDRAAQVRLRFMKGHSGESLPPPTRNLTFPGPWLATSATFGPSPQMYERGKEKQRKKLDENEARKRREDEEFRKHCTGRPQLATKVWDRIKNPANPTSCRTAHQRTRRPPEKEEEEEAAASGRLRGRHDAFVHDRAERHARGGLRATEAKAQPRALGERTPVHADAPPQRGDPHARVEGAGEARTAAREPRDGQELQRPAADAVAGDTAARDAARRTQSDPHSGPRAVNRDRAADARRVRRHLQYPRHRQG